MSISLDGNLDKIYYIDGYGFNEKEQTKKEEGILNRRIVNPIKNNYDPSIPKIILCSKKKDKKNHGKLAMGFVHIAAGVAILFIPLPGARAIGVSIAIGGIIEASNEIANAEVALSIGTDF